MKTQRNIFIAFLLNLSFSVFEFVGGAITGSIAIVSDAVHDLGDAASIGISLFLEGKSKKQPDSVYTYGYARYSVLGGMITTLILLIGSAVVICSAIGRILNPVSINYSGMILFAIIGAVVNLCAAWFTREGDSLNQRAVNLHMLEDVLGWIVVLIGAVVMRFTDIAILDPLLSMGVAVYILIHAVKNLKEILDLFLEKAPADIDIPQLQEHICRIDGVKDVHHIHLWSMNEHQHCATMHIVTDAPGPAIKAAVREELAEHGISHATLELEQPGEVCSAAHCHMDAAPVHHHHHHH